LTTHSALEVARVSHDAANWTAAYTTTTTTTTTFFTTIPTTSLAAVHWPNSSCMCELSLAYLYLAMHGKMHGLKLCFFSYIKKQAAVATNRKYNSYSVKHIGTPTTWGTCIPGWVPL